MSKMTRFAVYQLPFENPMIRELSFLNCDEVAEISDQFELVARVDARSLDQVFRIGNFVCKEDETLIQILGEMHSISVGDIIQDMDEDRYFVVARFGFEPIEMKEAV